jgi:hypothetical protein
MPVRDTLNREARVALSLRAQPLWFRVVKWLILFAVSVVLWRTGYFWWWILGGLAFGLTLHLIWRWKTRGWTQPWGGWNDLETAGKK